MPGSPNCRRTSFNLEGRRDPGRFVRALCVGTQTAAPSVGNVETCVETTMIDGNLLFLLELCALAVLVSAGIWRIFRSRSAKIDASAPIAHDMRRDGQQVRVQTESCLLCAGDPRKSPPTGVCR